jgi:hypothetical protein
MKEYTKEITTGLLLTSMIAGFAFWFFKHEPNAPLKIIIVILTAGIGIFAWIKNVIDKKRNLDEGSPAEDEFTKLTRIHAGSQAFLYSMYLWFAIFIFHTRFTNQEEMLGIGILGMSVIYGGCLLCYRSKGGFSEN